ncbi:NAC domain-containing protein 100-like [Pyrus ussuriensis x Pyrus communis]|uniref:NAC domain-containing protein 100-like n=1 Tax=Pyrus ussuriensis x Pyrus communis TaxID=2448454 RepID=A0A5N5GI18_9ROSA|nr:NAC domain-containing protein 100-like [Pyrus ussuriensis x Pyrus communis]
MPPYDNLVHEEYLFGTKEPWYIWEEYGGDQHYNQELYFLCKVKRLNLMGSHIHRKTDHAEENGNLNPVGQKRKLLYENQGSEQHAGWCLDEYSLLVGADGHDPKTHFIPSTKGLQELLTNSYFDLVICRLRKNQRSYSYKIKYRSTKDITT